MSQHVEDIVIKSIKKTKEKQEREVKEQITEKEEEDRTIAKSVKHRLK